MMRTRIMEEIKRLEEQKRILCAERRRLEGKLHAAMHDEDTMLVLALREVIARACSPATIAAQIEVLRDLVLGGER